MSDKLTVRVRLSSRGREYLNADVNKTARARQELAEPPLETVVVGGVLDDDLRFRRRGCRHRPMVTAPPPTDADMTHSLPDLHHRGNTDDPR